MRVLLPRRQRADGGQAVVVGVVVRDLPRGGPADVVAQAEDLERIRAARRAVRPAAVAGRGERREQRAEPLA